MCADTHTAQSKTRRAVLNRMNVVAVLEGNTKDMKYFSQRFFNFNDDINLFNLIK